MKKMTPQTLAGLSDRTKLVYAGRDPSEQFGFVNTPIYRGSTVIAPTLKELLDRSGRYIYGTLGTPTSDALESAWSAIAGAEGTVCVPSGLAAVSVALLSCLKAGDHLPHIRRNPAETLWRGNLLFRSDDRQRHRSLDAPEHHCHFHGSPRLAKF